MSGPDSFFQQPRKNVKPRMLQIGFMGLLVIVAIIPAGLAVDHFLSRPQETIELWAPHISPTVVEEIRASIEPLNGVISVAYDNNNLRVRIARSGCSREVLSVIREHKIQIISTKITKNAAMVRAETGGVCRLAMSRSIGAR